MGNVVEGRNHFTSQLGFLIELNMSDAVLGLAIAF